MKIALILASILSFHAYGSSDDYINRTNRVMQNGIICLKNSSSNLICNQQMTENLTKINLEVANETNGLHWRPANKMALEALKQEEASIHECSRTDSSCLLSHSIKLTEKLIKILKLAEVNHESY